METAMNTHVLAQCDARRHGVMACVTRGVLRCPFCGTAFPAGRDARRHGGTVRPQADPVHPYASRAPYRGALCPVL
jgi:hypothetical protein